MKKVNKMVSLISVCAMTAAIGATSASAAPLMGLPHIYDFEDFTPDTPFGSTVKTLWNGSTNANNETKCVESNDPLHGNVLRLDEGSWGIRIDGGLGVSTGAFVKETDNLLLSLAIRPDKSSIYIMQNGKKCYTTVANQFGIKYASAGKGSYFGQFERESDTTLKYTYNNYTGSGYNDFVESDNDVWKGLSPDKWYYINVKVNYPSGTADLALIDEEGNKLGDTVTVKMRQKESGESYAVNPQFSIYSKAMTSNYSSIYDYDNITAALYNAKDGSKVVKSYGIDDSLVKTDKGTFSLRFDQCYDKTNNFNDASNITITAADGTAFTDFTTVDSDFGGVKIQLNKALKQGTEYTVHFNRDLRTVFGQNVADYKFKTKQINKIAAVFKQGETTVTNLADADKNKELSADVTVTDINTEDVCAFAALYDESGRLIAIDTDKAQISGSNTFNLSLRPAKAEDLSKCAVRCYAWNSDNISIAEAVSLTAAE